MFGNNKVAYLLSAMPKLPFKSAFSTVILNMMIPLKFNYSFKPKIILLK